MEPFDLLKPFRKKLLLCYLLLGLAPQLLRAQLALSDVSIQTAPSLPGRRPAGRETTVSLKAVLEMMHQKYQWRFLYDEEAVQDLHLPASFLGLGKEALLLSVRQVLSEKQLMLTRIDEGQYAIVSKTGAKNREEILPEAAQIIIQGVVRDQLGNPLAGVSVHITGTTNGTITGSDGKYTLEAEPTDSLEFSYIGYTTQVVSVKNRVELDIVMEARKGGLNEVVVVGYGKQKKISLVGAQTSVRPEELQVPVRNLSTLLAGRLSGVVAVQRSGEPGYDGADVWIRGVSTFTNSYPLVLVDGVERDFSDIDPNDIESFSILKDAAATAVYGVRGANGVILITTKRGKEGKPRISFDFNQGLTTFTRLPDLADGVTYMKMANEAVTTRGENVRYSDEAIQKTAAGEDPDLYPNVDWMKQIFKDWGNNRQAHLNISGGGQTANYYVSAAYYDEVGLFRTDELARYNSSIKFKRYNFTSNISMKATRTTTVDLGVQGYIANGNYPGNGTGEIFGSSFRMPPVVIPPKYSNGRIAGLTAGASPNPFDELTQSGYVTEWRNQVYSNIRVKQDLSFWLKGLSFTSMFAFDAYNYQRIARTKSVDTWLATGRDSMGNLLMTQTRIGTNFLGYSRGNDGNRKYYTETALNYDRTFGAHHVTGLLLYNQSDYLNNFAGDVITSLPYRTRGLAGRGTYSYNDKYLFEFNFGYNGSENFSPENRYGFFPSVGAGWVTSGEKFFAPLKKAIQLLKFRFSYGLVGNSYISNGNIYGGRRFAYIATVANTTGYTFGKDRSNGYGGLDIGEYAADVTWETARKSNLGIELTTLRNQLDLQVDIFYEYRNNIFLRRSSVPGFLGLRANPYGNLGETENKGIDASVEYHTKIGSVNIGLRGNFTFNRNKIIEDDLPPWKYPWLERKGQKIGQQFGYIALGLFRDSAEILNSARQNGITMPGDIKFKDINGDGKIDAYDQYPIGYGQTPEIVYGFEADLEYKGIFLSAFFQGIGNVDIFLNGEGLVPFEQGGNRGNLFSNITDHWTPGSPDAHPFYPRLSFGTINDNYARSTWWVQNGRYMRLKTMKAGYNLPDKWFSRAGVSNASIYLIGYNLLTFSQFKLWDVELGDGRGAGYPNITTYSAGLSFDF